MLKLNCEEIFKKQIVERHADVLISTVFASEPSVNLSKVQPEKYDYCQGLHIFVYNNLKKVRK